MWRKLKFLWMLFETLLPGGLRKFLMRRRGAVIGHGVSLGPLSFFQCGKIVLRDGCHVAACTRFKVRGLLELGEDVKVGYFTRITAVEVKIGSETNIGQSVTITGAGRQAVLTIGPRCFVGEGCLFDLYSSVTLGEEVGVGGFSRIYTHGSWQSELDGFPIADGEVRIGDFSWLGSGVTIFAGVQIGEFATVGGGTVMRHRVPSYSMALGNPGKVVLQNGANMRHLTDAERFELCKRIVLEAADHQDWAGNKVEIHSLADECRVALNGRWLVFRHRVEDLEKVSAVLSFERMSDALILQIEAADIDWFDLSRRRCSHAESEWGAALRSAFSNHGIRFQTTGRGEIPSAPDTKRGHKPVSAATED
jgi:acetyltransferase-like isoleucine patch superfamily enzyme